MDCIRTRNLLSEYQDGTLDAAVAEALAAHLRGCGECEGCAGSLLAVRRLLQELPPDPAPPELFARVLEAVESEGRGAGAESVASGTDAAKPFFSRFRVPLEAAAAILLFATVYWYQRNPAPAARPPSSPVAQAPGTALPGAAPFEASSAAKGPASASRIPRDTPKTAKEEAPAAPKPRAWTEADLPSVPALRASTDSERIEPVSTASGPGADPAAGGTAESFPSGFLAAPPSRLLRPLPYGRDIVVDVKPEGRAGTEDRIAAAAFRRGGIVERVERGPAAGDPKAAGSVHVILPEAAATGFIDELRRIGNVPPEGMPPAMDIPAGPRPGTVAYAVRIRVR